jgi:hypothetical protein
MVQQDCNSMLEQARDMARAGICITYAVMATAGALAPSTAAAEMKFHYDCRVTDTMQVPQMGREGQSARLSHFTCRIRGGLLDGFTATGTNLLEHHEEGARLVGSTVIAQKKDSTLAYEVNDARRRLRKSKDGTVRWESTGTGVYRHATGSAAPLAGKSFTASVKSTGTQTFTIDSVVSD